MTQLINADWESDIEFDYTFGSVARVTDPYHGGTYSVYVPTYGVARWDLSAYNLLEWDVTFYFRYENTLSAQTVLCASSSGTSYYSVLQLNSSGYLQYVRGVADIPAVGTHQLSIDTWYKIRWMLRRDSSNGLFIVYVDDAEDINYSGNTVTGFGSGNTYLDYFGVNAITAGSLELYYDDLTLEDFIPWSLNETGEDGTLSATAKAIVTGVLNETGQSGTLQGLISTYILDTKAKRASALQFQKPFTIVSPFPNSEISSADRLHLRYLIAREAAQAGVVYGPDWQSG